MAGKRVVALDFTSRGFPEALGGAFICFHFRHEISLSFDIKPTDRLPSRAFLFGFGCEHHHQGAAFLFGGHLDDAGLLRRLADPFQKSFSAFPVNKFASNDVGDNPMSGGTKPSPWSPIVICGSSGSLLCKVSVPLNG